MRSFEMVHAAPSVDCITIIVAMGAQYASGNLNERAIRKEATAAIAVRAESTISLFSTFGHGNFLGSATGASWKLHSSPSGLEGERFLFSWGCASRPRSTWRASG